MSYFERRRNWGWQIVYQLVSYGPGHTPTVRDGNSGQDDSLEQASPFQVVIPAVPPGKYRITRRFLLAPGYTSDEKTLATRVTVKPCPLGQRPTFVTNPSVPTRDLGTPMCVARSK